MKQSRLGLREGGKDLHKSMAQARDTEHILSVNIYTRSGHTIWMSLQNKYCDEEAEFHENE